MTPNIKSNGNSPWLPISQWNSPLRNQLKERDEQPPTPRVAVAPRSSPPAVPKVSSRMTKPADVRPFRPRANFDPIRSIDQELEKLREAPSKVINERRRYVVRVELGTFRPESIRVIVEADKLVIHCDEEVEIDRATSVMKRFVRRINLPIEQLQTDMLATELNSLGTLTITMLKR
ncbi:Alpha crystallin/Hsp20 domain and HSP20-like chaperone domain-containing protein [Aphelenchoides fujianensis]|nr:Alpha crystallin/Hsp20 domain and HSP20-like chaperone domain-containing protein [Aphelenchoides fujianensis]